MVRLRQLALPIALACVACSGAPIESASASAADDDDDDDDGDATGVGETSDSDPTADPTGAPGTDPSADASTSIDADTGAATTEGDSAATTTIDAGESAGDTGTEDCHPRLNEIAMNVVGDDFSLEWIAISNPCPDEVDLAAYSLGWGGMDYTYGTHQLTGMLLSGACLVMGGPGASNTNYNPVFDQVADFMPDLQNADDADADAVAIFTGAAEDITAESVPVDAVIYGTANVNDLIDETGLVGAIDVGMGTDLETIARLPDAGGWVVNATPSPNDCGAPGA